jgi:hypothetical protein
MSDEQKKLYEEQARKLYPDSVSAGNMLNRELFKQGCEHAHNQQQDKIGEKDRVIDSLRSIIKDNERINENDISDKDNEIHRLNILYATLESRNEELVKALDEITKPIKYMQERLKEGQSLNGGTAVQLASSPS